VHGRTVGALHLTLRPGERSLNPADARLLNDLARQAGIAVQAARLTGELRVLTHDLQQSRERLVAAQEEERRRLRRDLHDGLGPALASAAFKVDAARNVLHRDPDRADGLLAGVGDQMQDTIADIRRLVYALRPPVLDQFGLAEGLRNYAFQIEGDTSFTVTAPASLASLPAAVEVAAYRIALEAMANAARHARAQGCRVRLAVDGPDLLVEVIDDGQGMPVERRHGVGLHSMRERAAELGGICTVESRAGMGTTVRARLPLAVAGAQWEGNP
jgi:signal transduction histidine kinase